MRDGLNIRVDGKWLDMPPNARLKYRVTNNIFFDGEKQRERSLPITFAPTGNNAAILGHLTEPGAVSTSQTLWNCELYSGRTFITEARLKVRHTARGYEAHVVGRWAMLQDTIGEANMRDIPWTTSSNGSWTKQDIAEGSYPQYPVWYPAMMMPKAAYQDVWGAESGSDNLFFGITGRYLPGSMPNSNDRAANAAYYLLYVLDRICKHFGLGVIQGEFRTDAELKNLLLHSIDIRNEDWNRLMFTAESVPDMKILDFFEVIEQLFCCQLELDNDRRLTARFLRDTAVRTDMQDWTDRLAGPMGRKWEGNARGVELRWPDKLAGMYPPYEPTQRQGSVKYDNNRLMVEDADTVNGDNDGRTLFVRCDNGWFKPTQAAGGRKFLYEDWNLQIQDADALNVLPEVADVASLPAITAAMIGKVVMVRSTGSYYMASGVPPFTFTYRWEKAFWNAAPIRIGMRERVIEPKGAPVPMDRFGPDYDGRGGGYRFVMRVPGFKGVRCRHDATAEHNPEAPTDMMPMFSFKRGIRTVNRTDWPGEPDSPGAPISTSFQYCYASSDCYDDDESLAYHYSLWWDGPRGLYETWWRDWARFLAGAQELDVLLNLRLADLLGLDLHRPVLLLGVKCWIKEIEFELPVRNSLKVRLMRAGD